MDLTPYKNCLALTNSIFIANEENPYRPCCWFKTYIDATDIDDYKQQLSKMDLEKTCDYCIKQDQGGSYSYRQQFNDADELIKFSDSLFHLVVILFEKNYSLART